PRGAGGRRGGARGGAGGHQLGIPDRHGRGEGGGPEGASPLFQEVGPPTRRPPLRSRDVVENAPPGRGSRARRKRGDDEVGWMITARRPRFRPRHGTSGGGST